MPRAVKTFDACTLEITADDTHITSIRFVQDGVKAGGDENAVIAQCIRELAEYFAGERKHFSVPIRAQGTPFQKAVWQEMAQIPYGEVRTYGDIAKAIGKQGAARAVGMACGKNPVAVLLPCHRVVGEKDVGGYAYGREMKRYLLELEQKTNKK